MDTKGAFIKRVTFRNNEDVDISELPSGIYFLKVKVNEGIGLAKLVKI